ncbi:Uma2 family endonuclease [bacterium]|nr:Uma2 family endonuclease [bacterium]
MTSVQAKPQLQSQNTGVQKTDWIEAEWQSFLALSNKLEYENARLNYFQGRYFIEMGTGPGHGAIDSLMSFLINLFCMTTGVAVRSLANTSYRQPEQWECQPDTSYYFGDRATQVPQGREIINLNENPPPDLVIEVADSSLASDLSFKRMLYEEMEVREYWVVNVQTLKITAFAILSTVGSERIRESRVLAGLSIDLLEAALQKGQELDNAQLGHWFMGQVNNQINN